MQRIELTQAAKLVLSYRICFASGSRKTWCFAVSRVTRANMKNIFVPNSLSSQNGLNCGNVGFCAKLATGKYQFAEAGFHVQDSTHFELFTRNMDDSGLPASWWCLDLQKHQRHCLKHIHFLKIHIQEKNEKGLNISHFCYVSFRP